MRSYLTLLIPLIIAAVSFVGCRPSAEKTTDELPASSAGLAVDVQQRDAEFVVEMTNHTERELVLRLGDKKVLLEPGEATSLPVPEKLPLRVGEVVKDEGKKRVRLCAQTFVPARAAKWKLRIPDGPVATVPSVPVRSK